MDTVVLVNTLIFELRWLSRTTACGPAVPLVVALPSTVLT